VTGLRVRGEQVEGDVDDEVFLSADEAAAADREKDGARVDAVPLGGGRRTGRKHE
jgi:hypothetical protein